jgi:hypothetical protein
MPMQEPQSLLGPDVLVDVVVLQHADGAIHLQDRQGDVVTSIAAMLAQSTIKFIFRNVLLSYFPAQK